MSTSNQGQYSKARGETPEERGVVISEEKNETYTIPSDTPSSTSAPVDNNPANIIQRQKEALINIINHIENIVSKATKGAWNLQKVAELYQAKTVFEVNDENANLSDEDRKNLQINAINLFVKEVNNLQDKGIWTLDEASSLFEGIKSFSSTSTST